MSDSTAPQRLPLATDDPLRDRLAELRRLLPEAFAEGKLAPAKLAQLLGEGGLALGPERYGLNWAGKGEAIRALQAPSVGTLLPCRDQSVDFDATGNLIIEGDNLEVLKLLQRSYYGKVKLIYIDPPYNTGNEFIYPDNYAEGLQDYLKFSGQVSAGGVKLTTNAETDGRYHSKWLSMMYPRLFLARNLLREDGVIFVSIDDHEVHNLRLVMNEIFGEENFLANIVWQKRYVSNVTAKHLSDMHDHILLYGRQVEVVKFALTQRSQEQLADYKNPDDDTRGIWRAQDLSASKPYQAGLFEIIGPTGERFSPPPGRYWRCNQATFEEWRGDGRIWFGKGGTGRPMLKAFLEDVQAGLTPNTWWAHDFAGHNKEATLETKALFGGEAPFDTPKPTKLIRRMLELADDAGGVILDFFAGSGTTAQAVLELNKQDGGDRKFILVQLPEPTERTDFPTIADITRERVRRVIRKLNKEAAEAVEEKKKELALEPSSTVSADLGFKAFKLGSSNFKIWDSATAPTDAAALAEKLRQMVLNLEDGREDEAILYEIILKSGRPLTAKIEKLDAAGKTAWRVADGALIVCLDRALTQDALRAIIDLKPQRVVCLDLGFSGNDALKTNTVLEMKSHGVEFQTA